MRRFTKDMKDCDLMPQESIKIIEIIPKPAENPSQILGKDTTGKTLFYFIIPGKNLLFLLGGACVNG